MFTIADKCCFTSETEYTIKFFLLYEQLILVKHCDYVQQIFYKTKALTIIYFVIVNLL